MTTGTAGDRRSPRGRPPAGLVAAVLLAHLLAWRAWTAAPALRTRPTPVQLRLTMPATTLPIDTPPVAPAPHAAPATPPAGRDAGAPAAPRASPATRAGQAAAPQPSPGPLEPTPAPALATADAAPFPAPAADAGAAGPPAALALPPTARLPAAARWQYLATQRRRGLLASGSGTLDWAPDGDRYTLHLAWEVSGMPPRSQTSSGGLGPAGLTPRRYGVRTRSEFATHLDAAQGRVVFSSNRPPLERAEGLQDRASVLLQLAGWLAADPARFAPGALVRVPTVGSHDAADWEFVVDGPERLDLPAGPVATLRLTRTPAGPWDLRVEAWFAPGLDYAPVRLRLTPPNGDWLDLQWSGTDKR